MTEVYRYTPEEEQAVDALVDTGLLTYDDARRRLGIAAVQPEDVTANDDFRTPNDHRPSRPSAARGVQYGDNGRVETPDGIPYEDRPYTELSPEQKKINRQGMQLVRETLRQVRENKDKE